MLNNVKVVNAAKKMVRDLRKPSHTFFVNSFPFAVQTFCVAPVLPGETLKNLNLQSRCVTKPITSPLIGWWLEHYFFYVPFSAMKTVYGDKDYRDVLKSAMLSPDAKVTDTGGLGTVVSSGGRLWQFAGAVDWVSALETLIVERFFRDEGETADCTGGKVAGAFLAQAKAPGWLDSLGLQSELSSYDETLTVGADDSFTMAELEALQRAYQFQMLNGLTDMTYEDFLRSAGVKVPGHVDVSSVELLRFMRSWQYPSNTVNATDGSVSSAVSWSIAERGDKDRYFKEPGFIIGVTVTRPKVYYGNQKGAVVGAMNDAFSWLPAVMQSEQGIGVKKYAAGAGPVSAQSNAYWFDVADLLLYGDQFLSNHSGMTVSSCNGVSLPTAAGQKRFLSGADIAALFVGGTYAADAFNANVGITQDGVANFNIMSTLRDTTTGIFSMPAVGG